jgi:RimJ/RimL family protein N-acetyltransferase
MKPTDTPFYSLSIYTLPNIESPTPVHIGRMNLDWSDHGPIHRCMTMGILIGPVEYTGKGYGSEAIRWQVTAAFEWFGAHRVELNVFEWNARAIHVYEKLLVGKQ